MDTNEIVTTLEAERDRLNAAIHALSGRSNPGETGGRGRRHLSAASRAKIGAAMRKRWAERKKKEKAA